MNSDFYVGVIIEESLESLEILGQVKILQTDVSPVTASDATPWLEKWTCHTIEVSVKSADIVAEQISKIIRPNETWYADYHNSRYHYIIFRNKVFKVDRSLPEQYGQVNAYGISMGIPPHQVDFH